MPLTIAANPFGAREILDLGDDGRIAFHRLDHLERTGLATGLDRFPYSVKVLLESVLRQCGTCGICQQDVANLAGWSASDFQHVEVPFKPARVIAPDFTGATVLVDLAAMRGAVKRLGGNPSKLNPQIPLDLVVDHSVQVDHYGDPDAFAKNSELEFLRNHERFELVRWGQNAVKNFRVVPPGVGIVHQVNLEFLARGIVRGDDGAGLTAFPDTVLGADSHTTMINCLGVLGWGVGGIEAEAAMLGHPLCIPMPQVVGVRLFGRLQDGVTATDLALTVTEQLRRKGVVDKLVEFYGPGISTLAIADRATVANMAPEYGATVGFFPLDTESLDYLRRTGRPPDDVRLLERYSKEQGLFRTEHSPEPTFNETVSLDLASVEPSLAGPRRPQDRVPLSQVKSSFHQSLSEKEGFCLPEKDLARSRAATPGGKALTLTHGSIVLAAITSCTNTSNPSVMIGAGLLARNAVRRGLTVAPHVKTSLAPGSRVVIEYLRAAGLLAHLEALGFYLVGYGCTSCIGNSGPLDPSVARAVTEGRLVAVAVLSGNRNFEARIHPLANANYLASPPLVVAYGIAGTVNRDLTTEPLGNGADGKPVYLSEIWPSRDEVLEVTRTSVSPAMYERLYSDAFGGSPEWRAIPAATGELYPWRAGSTYVQEPPFFADLTRAPAPVEPIRAARVLVMLGDSVTTDHIAPAGDIPVQSPAGQYLVAAGVQKADFNTYGARRGSHEVSVRGTFASIRLKNLLVPGVEGGVTLHHPSGEQLSIYEASRRYAKDGTALIVLAGKEYGTGSSRDWAAKGPRLLGVRAVIAESFERIHRSNLVGMGILPLQFLPDEGAESLGITGKEIFHLEGISSEPHPRQEVVVCSVVDGAEKRFRTIARLDSAADVGYYQHGGVLPMVVRESFNR